MHSTALAWRGLVEVRVTDHSTGLMTVERVQNLITDVGLDWLASELADKEAGTGGLYSIGVGTDGTTATASDTALGAEVFRNPLLTRDLTATGECTSIGYIPPGEANGVQIEEVGWFLSDGRMVARLTSYSHAKQPSESIQFNRTDTLTRA